MGVNTLEEKFGYYINKSLLLVLVDRFTENKTKTSKFIYYTDVRLVGLYQNDDCMVLCYIMHVLYMHVSCTHDNTNNMQYLFSSSLL